MGDVVRAPFTPKGAEFRRRLGALKARFGTDEAMALLVRATGALDLLGIDRKKGIWFALHGAECRGT